MGEATASEEIQLEALKLVIAGLGKAFLQRNGGDAERAAAEFKE